MEICLKHFQPYHVVCLHPNCRKPLCMDCHDDGTHETHKVIYLARIPKKIQQIKEAHQKLKIESNLDEQINKAKKVRDNQKNKLRTVGRNLIKFISKEIASMLKFVGDKNIFKINPAEEIVAYSQLTEMLRNMNQLVNFVSSYDDNEIENLGQLINWMDEIDRLSTDIKAALPQVNSQIEKYKQDAIAICLNKRNDLEQLKRRIENVLQGTERSCTCCQEKDATIQRLQVQLREEKETTKAKANLILEKEEMIQRFQLQLRETQSLQVRIVDLNKHVEALKEEKEKVLRAMQSNEAELKKEIQLLRQKNQENQNLFDNILAQKQLNEMHQPQYRPNKQQEIQELHKKASQLKQYLETSGHVTPSLFLEIQR
eukprot:TRINITY_DN28110_c0_g1_i7.p1 TRINITY_DN28110_c0_g1~~TRINITY_DN28110_c0_g1_i7.p1  ORF type:complete len:371 (+),score=50.23 TRINITY_DN28110_c0_g1_i7:2-1114(+)